MRIRKRFHLSDPKLNHSPAVLQQTNLQLHPDRNIRVKEVETDCRPSDPPNQPALSLPSDYQTGIDGEKGKKICYDAIRQKEGEKVKENGSNDHTRKESILLAAGDNGLLLPRSNSHQVDEMWFEGDKVMIPVKKRRSGSFLERIGQEKMLEKEKKMKPKMKPKPNKKCSVQRNGDDEVEYQGKLEAKETNEQNNIHVKNVNKRGSSSEIMEGTRCSRVNGRGWRCCQQTLVGYSLCEHLLGKSRLRTPQQDAESERLPVVQSSSQDQKIMLEDDSSDDDEDDDYNYNDDDNGGKLKTTSTIFVRKRKKRMKLGMVKARSLSSLLNPTNDAVVVAAGSWNNSSN